MSDKEMEDTPAAEDQPNMDYVVLTEESVADAVPQDGVEEVTLQDITGEVEEAPKDPEPTKDSAAAEEEPAQAVEEEPAQATEEDPPQAAEDDSQEASTPTEEQAEPGTSEEPVKVDGKDTVVFETVVNGQKKMFIKDKSGKIVGELQPMDAKPAKVKLPVSKSTRRRQNMSSPAVTQEDIQRVQMNTKLTVAGVDLPSDATKDQINQALSKAAKIRRKERHVPLPESLTSMDYKADSRARRCDVPNCKSVNYDRDLKYFRVPRKADYFRRRWMHALGKTNAQADDKPWFVCELHFEADKFENRERTRLKLGAVPSIAVAKVTSVVTVTNQMQEIMVPPARLGLGGGLNAPLSALLADDKPKSASEFEIPLIQQQIRVHKFALEKLERSAGVAVGVDAEIVIDKSAPIKEIRAKAETLARRKRIKELEAELYSKQKSVREEKRMSQRGFNDLEQGTAAATASTLMTAVRAPSRFQSITSYTRLKQETQKRAVEAKKTRDFYVARTMAALRGETLSYEDFDPKKSSKANEHLQHFAKLQKDNSDTIYLQPGSRRSILPPIILSGDPMSSMKFLSNDKLKTFLHDQAARYAQKMTDDEDGVAPKVGFILSTIEDPDKLMDLKEVVEMPNQPEPLSLLEKDVLAEAVNETLDEVDVPSLVYQTSLTPAKDVAAGNAQLQSQIHILQQSLSNLKTQNDNLNSRLQASKHEVEFMATKIKAL